ncbi:DUF2080 family transposase-associated protein [Methanococcus voltae]|uniref:DUF2080 family transposase-associated protein n=1 Tax=Methanococcus voltae TaxID=2188 RepID=UPI000A05D681
MQVSKIKKTVKKWGNSGGVAVPKGFIGKSVLIQVVELENNEIKKKFKKVNIKRNSPKYERFIKRG